jgi:hypothetical protein
MPVKGATKTKGSAVKVKGGTKAGGAKRVSGGAKKGTRRGRPPGVSTTEPRALELLKGGAAVVDVAKKLGVTTQRIYQIRTKNGGSVRAARREAAAKAAAKAEKRAATKKAGAKAVATKPAAKKAAK